MLFLLLLLKLKEHCRVRSWGGGGEAELMGLPEKPVDLNLKGGMIIIIVKKKKNTYTHSLR